MPRFLVDLQVSSEFHIEIDAASDAEAIGLAQSQIDQHRAVRFEINAAATIYPEES